MVVRIAPWEDRKHTRVREREEREREREERERERRERERERDLQVPVSNYPNSRYDGTGG